MRRVRGARLKDSPECGLLTPARRKYSLDQWVAACDSEAPLPADLAAWGGGEPVGREVWRGASSSNVGMS
ncbi:hypothetical protein DWV00_30955 [Trinickia dinghuensis]|uniref:Uncharacterized protein n=1 Tax=Trinickia dinghuensis TaxID=2291023 RepID=A0A3D8JRI0_9BURK|nr:hypothetical protein DWV00_30955 [Trinickia dinghuensis]